MAGITVCECNGMYTNRQQSILILAKRIHAIDVNRFKIDRNSTSEHFIEHVSFYFRKRIFRINCFGTVSISLTKCTFYNVPWMGNNFNTGYNLFESGKDKGPISGRPR